jgi:ABC-type lipoprotein release transport system permease subunit
LTLTIAPMVLLAVALIATYLPARRAMKISPIRAMNGEDG